MHSNVFRLIIVNNTRYSWRCQPSNFCHNDRCLRVPEPTDGMIALQDNVLLPPGSRSHLIAGTQSHELCIAANSAKHQPQDIYFDFLMENSLNPQAHIQLPANTPRRVDDIRVTFSGQQNQHYQFLVDSQITFNNSTNALVVIITIFGHLIERY
ncbi:hypothetical protein GCM10011297_01950 [Bacterioplanes sanyensis]|uniref:hypothetical protein n=1 Tax=Bacterioplanes sanyensis TaxID=1249553 RepID=UPI001672291E|nr:hypothetical protein [Bacterioplanes sanyensis]GGY32640.1 hypothetical protein GCM10011297_01950 [Bacterioplanes sanyensis]